MEHTYANRRASRVGTSYTHEEGARDVSGRALAYGWAGIRIALGIIFAWAFVDKVFGLGYSTPSERAWINGGNPTAGYLGSSVGPFAGFFHAIAGDSAANVLFMFGLAAIGAALLAGVGVRIAGYAGALMMALMYASHVPWAASGATNPLIDDHVVYAIALLGLSFAHAGRTFGFGRAWSESAPVRRFPLLE